MNLASVRARATAGIEAPAVRVEVHLSGGLPALAIVGLPEAAVREAREECIGGARRMPGRKRALQCGCGMGGRPHRNQRFTASGASRVGGGRNFH